MDDFFKLLHFQRLDMVNEWFELLPEVWEEKKEHALEMCKLALALLEICRRYTAVSNCLSLPTT